MSWYRLLKVIVILASIAQGWHRVYGVVVVSNIIANTTNKVQPGIKQHENNTIIKYNSIRKGNSAATKTQSPNSTATSTAGTSTSHGNSYNEYLRNVLPSATSFPIVELSRTIVPTNGTSNSTTVKPLPPRKNNKIILYVLIPLGCVLFLFIVYCVIRHAQKIQRKRRLERELLHQYSYPNSEADEMEYDQRILEVESVINNHFSATGSGDKDFAEDIPQVAVTIGDGPKLVMQDTPIDLDDTEASTSFNC